MLLLYACTYPFYLMISKGNRKGSLFFVYSPIIIVIKRTCIDNTYDAEITLKMKCGKHGVLNNACIQDHAPPPCSCTRVIKGGGMFLSQVFVINFVKVFVFFCFPLCFSNQTIYTATYTTQWLFIKTSKVKLGGFFI